MGGAVECWGFSSRPAPSALDGVEVSAISAGSNHACGIEPTGDVHCAGDNRSGAVGPFACESCPIAQRVELGGGAVAVDLGLSQSCAVMLDGTIWCWGTGLTDGVDSPPRRVEGVDGVVALSVGWELKCALDRRGRVWCWGGSAVGDGTSTRRTEPAAVVELYLRSGG